MNGLINTWQHVENEGWVGGTVPYYFPHRDLEIHKIAYTPYTGGAPPTAHLQCYKTASYYIQNWHQRMSAKGRHGVGAPFRVRFRRVHTPCTHPARALHAPCTPPFPHLLHTYCIPAAHPFCTPCTRFARSAVYLLHTLCTHYADTLRTLCTHCAHLLYEVSTVGMWNAELLPWGLCAWLSIASRRILLSHFCELKQLSGQMCSGQLEG